jgi:hypothetical protein
MNCTEAAHDMEQRRVLVNMALNFRVTQKAENFFSRRTMLWAVV